MKNTKTRKMVGVWLVLLGIVGGTANFLLGRQAEEKDLCGAAVIRGTVRSPEGTSLYGILVKAKGEGKNYTTSVFTDEKGNYDFPLLPLGTYQVWVGTTRKETVRLTESDATQDFTVQLGPDLIDQTTGSSWFKFIPGTEAEKALVTANCYGCHSALRMIKQAPASPDGWAQIVEKMLILDEKGRPGSTADDPYRLRMSPQHKEAVTKFLANNIKPDTKDTYVTKAIVRPTGEAARAVFTEWEIPSKVGATSWTDPKGIIWYMAGGSKVGPGLGRLDPRTGEIQEWYYPAKRSSGFHDVMGDERGDLWVTGAGLDKILKFDVRTSQYTTWDISPATGTYPHTGDFDQDRNYWFSLYGGENSGVANLNPRTGQMTNFPATEKFAGAYGLASDRKGNVWFTEIKVNKVAKIDRSGKLTEYTVPTPNSEPRRLQVDSKDRVWFTESRAAKIAVLDPATGKITEYDPGIPNGFPYFIKIDKFDKIWFDDVNGNMVGKFDPETKKFSLYLLPTPESFARDASFDYSSDPYAIVFSEESHPLIGRMYVRKAGR